MRKFLSLLLAVLMIASLSGIAFAEETTAVGTPRTETLIVETQTPTDVPGQFNSYMQGTQMGFGIHQLMSAMMWEMDTVKGKRGVTKSCLLVLSERKTRMELIFKMANQGAAAVVETLDSLERKWGEQFPIMFKTITVDNGVEFSDTEGIERSVFDNQKKRTSLFYCHAYSSWERGTNENINKMIRRHIPKGVDFDDKTDDDIIYVENWINSYPRRLFRFQTSKALFDAEMEKLG